MKSIKIEKEVYLFDGEKIKLDNLSKCDADIMCETVINAAQEFFKNPENKKGYEEWLKNRKNKEEEK